MKNLIFTFLTFLNIWQFIYPFLIKFDVKFNILKLKGYVAMKLLKFINLEFKFRIKNGYIYIYFKNKEIKEKISNKNINLVFITNLIKQVYFRHQLLNFNLRSDFGFVLDSMVTAVGCGYIDVLTKCVIGKLKNNKKSAHILIDINPKYNEDIFNFRLVYQMRMSAVDIIYTLIYTFVKTIVRKMEVLQPKGEL